VAREDLTPQERAVLDQTPMILALVGSSRDRLPPIYISETMRVTSDDTQGVWDSSLPAIVIRRTKLGTLVGFAATRGPTNISDGSGAEEGVSQGIRVANWLEVWRERSYGSVSASERGPHRVCPDHDCGVEVGVDHGSQNRSHGHSSGILPGLPTWQYSDCLYTIEPPETGGGLW
jgi:hypothetical protein